MNGKGSGKERGTRMVPGRTGRLAMTSMMGALALTLSAAESLLPPIPFLPPGAKPGLSNLATMYAASSAGLLPALAIALLKGIFAGILRGSTAFLMSTAGGIASTFVMWLMTRWKGKPFGWIGVGVGGALFHNLAQLRVAAALTTPAVVFYLPALLLFGLAAGTLTGVLLRLSMPVLERLEGKLQN